MTDADKKKFDATAEELVKKGTVGFGEMTRRETSAKADGYSKNKLV